MRASNPLRIFLTGMPRRNASGNVPPAHFSATRRARLTRMRGVLPHFRLGWSPDACLSNESIEFSFIEMRFNLITFVLNPMRSVQSKRMILGYRLRERRSISRLRAGNMSLKSTRSSRLKWQVSVRKSMYRSVT